MTATDRSSVQLPAHDRLREASPTGSSSGPASGAKASPLDGTSYTEAHPVAAHYECRPCGATLSGRVPITAADLFTRAHASCQPPAGEEG